MLVKAKTIYEHALKHKYAIGAFNVSSLESLQAVLGAAEKERSPVIVQISTGARKYVKDFKIFVSVVKMYTQKTDVPILLHHDHCDSVEKCIEAIDAGVDSVMYDGSHLDFQKNINNTRRVVEYANKFDVAVEAELGCLPGFEDDIFAENVSFTNPDLVQEFIEKTACTSLAVSVGTSHGGVKSDDYLPMDLNLLESIIQKYKNFPFVLHGGASLPPELIDEANRYGGKVKYLRNCSEDSVTKAVELGISKVNMDVDNFLVFTTEIRKFFINQPGIYDPRKYLDKARDAFENQIRHKMKNVLNSSNQYDLRDNL